MTKRKPISKKIRFEVLKRDSFTCQYCGSMAPDVVLEIDHINPVSSGGDNDILNLITSCFDCNRGKGKKKLTEKEEIKKQQEQLKELNNKREQLEMMLEWREALNKFDNELVDKFEEALKDKTGSILTEHGKEKVTKWIKSFGLVEVLDCLDISVSQYFDKEHSEETIKKTFDYIPKIASVRKKEKSNPTIKKKHYIKGILRNRLAYVNNNMLFEMLDGLTEGELEEIQEIALIARNWTDFKELVNEWYEGVVF